MEKMIEKIVVPVVKRIYSLLQISNPIENCVDKFTLNQYFTVISLILVSCHLLHRKLNASRHKT